MNNEEKDEILWKTAKKRAAFKYHFMIYIIMNIIFWTIYYISLRTNTTPPSERDSIPWPVYPLLGWGIGVLFNYVDVYKSHNSLAEKEYQKLKNKNL